MNRKLVDALQDCLDAMRRGEPSDACLARFPEMADQLRPLLSLAQETQRMAGGEPAASALDRSRANLQGEVERLREAGGRSPAWRAIPRFAIASLAMAVIVILAGGITASAQSIPGDLLYPVKLTAEDLRLRWSSAKDRRLLEERFAEQRENDIKRAISLGRKAVVSFEGVVASKSGDTWVVGSVTVVLTPTTYFDEDIAVGMTVEVEGETQPSGSVIAYELRLRLFDLVGVVQNVGSKEWNIAGQLVQIDRATTIDPGVGPGDMVRATLHRDDSGTLTARSIRRYAASTATPAPPVTQTPTHVAVATQTIEEENEPEDESGRETEAPDDTPTPKQAEDEEDEHEDEEGTPGENRPQEVEFSGILVSASGSRWMIDSTQVEVSGDTEIRDNPVPGDKVKVKAVRRTDGSLLARKIERED